MHVGGLTKSGFSEVVLSIRFAMFLEAGMFALKCFL